MPGVFFFMAVGGLGVSLAGFAGLIATLTPEEKRVSVTARWRIANVVEWGLQVTFLGFGVIAIHALLDDTVLTTRVASGIAALIVVIRGWRANRRGPVWPDERYRRYAIAFDALSTLVVLGNVVVASVGYLEAIVLFLLGAPAGVFVTAIKEAMKDAPAEENGVNGHGSQP